MSALKLVSKKEQQGVEDSIIVDKNGYYKVLVGCFNTYNRSGIFYRIKDPKSLLRNKTILNRRITEGTLRSEEEHPDYKGMDNKEIISRTIFLDSTKVCAHIKAIEMVDTGKTEQGWSGYNITEVYAWIKPTGPFGPTLKESFDNPDENVYFSVRSLVKQSFIGTTIVRDVLDVSTWDHVYEGGIEKASQWNAAGIESIDACIDGICEKDLHDMHVGNEKLDCKDGQCLLNIIDNLGDGKTKVLNW